MEEALNELRGDIPEIIDKLKRLAFGNPVICQHCTKETGVTKIDKEAAIYLLDRVLGRPRQEIDQRVKAAIMVTADEYELAIRLAIEEE